MYYGDLRKRDKDSEGPTSGAQRRGITSQKDARLVTSAALLRILLLLEQGASLRVLPPELDQRLANQEEHRADLANGEETPDGRLLHEVGRDRGGDSVRRQDLGLPRAFPL